MYRLSIAPPRVHVYIYIYIYMYMYLYPDSSRLGLKVVCTWTPGNYAGARWALRIYYMPTGPSTFRPEYI